MSNSAETDFLESPASTGDFQALIGLFVRRRFTILFCVLAGLVISGALTLTQAPVYQATALLQVSVPNTGAGNDVQGVTASQLLAKTDAAIVISPGFLASAAKGLGDGFTTGGLEAAVSATPKTDTQLITLAAVGPSPAKALRIVASVARFAVGYISNGNTANTQRSVTTINDQINSLTANNESLFAARAATTDQGAIATINVKITVNNARIQTLASELAVLIGTQNQTNPALSLVGPASTSATPVSPRPTLNFAIGFIFGFVVGLVLAWIRDQLDRSVRSVADVERITRRPVLAVVPVQRGLGSSDPAMADVFDVLRVNLSLSARAGEGRVITVTSAREGEGKTYTTLGAGRALARAGRRVVIVDADLRRKGASRGLEAQHQRGLAEVLRGGAKPLDVLVDIQPGLLLMPAGVHAADPAILLESPTFDETILSLCSEFDIVLIDTPPIRQVADATIAAARSDGVVVAVRLGVVGRGELAAMCEALASAHFALIGSVIHSPDVAPDRYVYAPAEPALWRRLLRRTPATR